MNSEETRRRAERRRLSLVRLRKCSLVLLKQVKLQEPHLISQWSKQWCLEEPQVPQACLTLKEVWLLSSFFLDHKLLLKEVVSILLQAVLLVPSAQATPQELSVLSMASNTSSRDAQSLLLKYQWLMQTVLVVQIVRWTMLLMKIQSKPRARKRSKLSKAQRAMQARFSSYWTKENHPLRSCQVCVLSTMMNSSD